MRRYWRKLNNLSQEILSIDDNSIPDLIALCEVENDSCLIDLTRRSLLRHAGYEYLMTSSPDQRGIDVALMYRPVSFRPLNSRSIRVDTIKDMRATRDILYVGGRIITGDTLHVFVVHAPSRRGGEQKSRPFRMATANALLAAVDSVRQLSPSAPIIIAGDFNDYADSEPVKYICRHELKDVSKGAHGMNGAKGTYRYRGEWNSLDHIITSKAMSDRLDTVFVHAPLFLLEEDRFNGGYMPRRTYKGTTYQPGYSDHLPLVARFRL